MSEYDAGNQRILDTVEKVTHNTVSTAAMATQSVLSKIKPNTRIEIRSAKDDVNQAQQAMNSGKTREEIINTIKQSPVAQRLKAEGKDVDKYANLIFKKGQINEAVAKNPSIAKTQEKTLEKTL